MASAESNVERIYTVPLAKAWLSPRQRRAARAVNILRSFALKHMKGKVVKIGSDVNELMWKRGIRSPPRRIQVKMVKDSDGVVEVSLPEKVSPSQEAAE